MQPRLTRSRTEKVLAGVCGGLGEYFGVDPVIVRLIFVVLVLTTGIAIIAYPILWLVTPLAGAERVVPPSTGDTVQLRGEEVATNVAAATPAAARPNGERWRGALGMGLLALGLILLADQFGLDSDIVWPLVIMALGVGLVWRRGKIRS
jgi:phage shock protein C